MRAQERSSSASLTRARLNGRSRSRLPVASANALAMTAAVGPCAASPVAGNGSPGRSMMFWIAKAAVPLLQRGDHQHGIRVGGRDDP